MIGRRILFKEVSRALRMSKRPGFGFFTGKTEQEQEVKGTEKGQEGEEAKESPRNVLAQFNEDELNMPRLKMDTLMKAVLPYQAENKRAFDKLTTEIETLYHEKDHIPSLRSEIKALEDVGKINKEKLNTVIERAKQAEAEGERIETRLNKEIEKSKVFAISKFSGDILEILDNLELCIENCKKDAEKNSHILESDFFQGVEMTYKNALNIFHRFNINPIEEGIGSEMNPNIHDVMFVAPNPERPNNEVMYVAKKGYMIGERVLRASKVGVVKNN